MTTDTLLIEKREELKRRLTAGEYKTLVDVFLAWTNRLIQKVTRQTKPLPLWLMTVILSLVAILIAFGESYITGGLTSIRKGVELIGLGYRLGILAWTSGFPITIVSMIVINQSIHRIFVLWHDDILDATESATSSQAFEDWLEKVCNRRLHFLFIIFFSLLIGLFGGIIGSTVLGAVISNGFIFGVIFVYLITGAIFYQFAMMLLLPRILRRYDLKLFAADPATSELLSRLSGELVSFVYFIAFYSAISTLFLVPVGAQIAGVGIFVVLVFWVPIIAVFTLNQSALSSIVRRAKWKTLNEIQAKVEKLQASENLEAKETMDAINRLLDYHERVNKTRISALDFRAYLSFINSLLLPLLAFLLSNLDLVSKLFARKP